MSVKKTISKKSMLHSRLDYYYGLIERTIISCMNLNKKKIISTVDLNIVIDKFETLLSTIEDMRKSNSKEMTSKRIEVVFNELKQIMKNVGTEKLSDVFTMFFSGDYLKKLELTKSKKDKLNILLSYAKPYKIVYYKDSSKKSLIVNESDKTVIQSVNISCFDCENEMDFYHKVYSIKCVFHHNKSSLIVYCSLDEVVLLCSSNAYIKNTITLVQKKKPKDVLFKSKIFDVFVSSMCMKGVLIYNEKSMYDIYLLSLQHLNRIKQKSISHNVRDFLNISLYEQRNILSLLLMDVDCIESQYLAYLLYDLLSSENNDVIDTKDQMLIYDSLTWNLKKRFRMAMKETIEYTSKLSNIDSNKIPLEQQICLMKANDNVKEKAMNKLKEVKSKTEDSGSKARQYLDGLLKIPFKIYRQEPCLLYIEQIKERYHMNMNLLHSGDNSNMKKDSEKKSGFEIIKSVTDCKMSKEHPIKKKQKYQLVSLLTNGKRDKIIANIYKLNELNKKYKIKNRITHSGKKIEVLIGCIETHINQLFHKDCDENNEYIQELCEYLNISCDMIYRIKENNTKMLDYWGEIEGVISDNRKVLDKAVHGHHKAKKGIERVLGQWMNGELTGYCFGFEGPPGVGKTSLAKKGLANCLKDENGVPRPFSFIAIGGSSNGSTLDGHNYTYVGSTWGRVVDILMESKCMNPIIFIDELDKVSKTEHGKEIIGILTHLVDPTQNDDFQDKYFNGISLDLSKVLFIFSYNDVSSIDRILLDRIHRIRFENLSQDEKVVIVNDYILPELYDKTGLNKNIVIFTDEIIRFIIEHYTCESGVRKLKEVLFDIVSDINLDLFKKAKEIPIKVTEEDIVNIYLKERIKIKPTKIPDNDDVGAICGLWANELGMGGIITIQSSRFLSNTMELKLTGLQGDVMKESMNVAKTLALQLSGDEAKKKFIGSPEDKQKNIGIHIHCPEGAVPKDGPSAGTAITTCLFSLINNRKIKRDIAITGEINLRGCVTAIGGLKYKILGGIKAGVTTFLFPTENQDDFDKFKEEYPDMMDKATYIAVSKIEEVFEIVFADE